MNRRDRRDLRRLHAGLSVGPLEGRQVVPKGTPGAVAHTVTREMPVTVLQHAGGRREVVDHDAEPCFACPCCVLWSVTLDTLGGAVLEHDRDNHAEHGAPVDHATGALSCLICAVLAGEAST